MSSSNTAAFKAYSELSLTTVNIVPSTGFITALYAISEPFFKAFAMSILVSISLPSID